MPAATQFPQRRMRQKGVHTRHTEWEGEALKGTTCQPQSMTIWESIHLIGCPRGSGKAKLGVVKGVICSVEHIAEDTVTLKMLPEYRNGLAQPPDERQTPQETTETQEEDDVSAAKEEVTVPLADVAHVLRLTPFNVLLHMSGKNVSRPHGTS